MNLFVRVNAAALLISALAGFVLLLCGATWLEVYAISWAWCARVAHDVSASEGTGRAGSEGC